MIKYKSDAMYYKTLFNLSWQHTDNLLLLIANDLTIKDINPAAASTLNLKIEKMVNKPLNQLFKEWSLEPIVPEFMNNSRRETFVWWNNQKLAINWTFLSSFDSEYLLIGTMEIAPIDVPQQIIQLENVLKFTPGLLYWKDLNSVYLGCNDEFARLAGLNDRQEVKGKTDFDLIWKDRASSYVAIDQEVMQSGIAQLNYVELIAISNQKTITAITNKVPLRDQNDQIVGIIGITTDITHQKEIELALSVAKEKAEAANLAKTEFIANMSHDIRTPLTGVVGMSKMLEASVSDPSQKEYAHCLGESGDQLLHMLNDVLDVVSADNANEQDLHEEPVDVRRIIQDILELERPSTLIKNIQFFTDIEKNVPNFILTDHTKLHRILLNLVGNAIKFTEKGHVRIDVQLSKIDKVFATLKFQISDTGIGIAPELQDKVFDRFFRITPSFKGVYTGHGVGLHIAQSYAHLLGSEIRLTSEAGKGTTFDFTLSVKIVNELEVVDNSHPPGLPQPAISSLPNTSQTMLSTTVPHILLVEDNPIARRVLENMMTQMGYDFMSTVDGESALQLACLNAFDLIITDIGLPGISGIELTKHIRNFEQSNKKSLIPIIGLTAHAENKVKNECIIAGMTDVFSKPMTMENLEKIKSIYLQPKEVSSESIITSKKETSKLGVDLPDTEEELFDLEQFVLFDEKLALQEVNNDQSLLPIILDDLIKKIIPETMAKMQQAYIEKDWDKIAFSAHYMKGALVYTGTPKMKYACQYLERYHKAGHTQALDKLYEQLIQVGKQTYASVKVWIDKNK
jgi:two-component system aerobic respiration control sensor histidine kinase ArcB